MVQPALEHLQSVGGYRLAADYSAPTRVKGINVISDDLYLILASSGALLIKEGYIFDGASGPMVDTINSSAAALIHDGLYQLLRTNKIPKRMRKLVDLTFRDLLAAGGVGFIRRWYAYTGVKFFGGIFA